MGKKILYGLGFLFLIGDIIAIYFFSCLYPIKVESITYELKEKEIITHLNFKNIEVGKCIFEGNEITFENGSCSVIVPNLDSLITVKTKWNEKEIKVSPNVNEVIDFDVEENKIYLAIGEKKKLKVAVDKLGSPNITPTYESSAENVVSIENDIVTGISKGISEIKVKIGNIEKKIQVQVTDLITLPTLTPKKQKLKCGIYTNEDNKLLDDILAYKINNAGYETRAGVVAALRFLTLEFPYQLNYFFESGRLNNNTGGAYVDGEGRFYHKGLYLSESKYSSLVKTKYGPATWGCPLTNWQDEAGFKPGVRYPNGLDCSGFVTWAMFNGGFDPKDTGAGDNPWTDEDLSDIGVHIPITKELLESKKIKAGDIIASDGHTALVGGIKDNIIYVAESTTYYYGVVMHPYTFDELLETPYLDYIINMDEYYKNEGNYTDYWE